ncbi:MAG: DEAD/DEAH box helicase [Aigarchaeota archaeon]|nr:DEAD/DEAH box helicase [Candidatus Geocrenenecus dongiae]
MESVKPRIDSMSLLDSLGYSYYYFDEEGEYPEIAEIRFEDILPEIVNSRSRKTQELVGKNLYRHQYEAYDLLRNGSNIILKSGTGSGKTEAWFLYTAKHRVKTLSIYPTLALAYDQLGRLSQYCSDLNMKIVILDALKKTELISKYGLREVIKIVHEADLVVTNPAFLLNEVKKMVLKKPSILSSFFEKLRFLVVDDFDFYGPREIALLFAMLKLIVDLFGKDIQFAFMTATLSNPEDVAEYLEKINGRKTKTISGKAFKAPNKVYIILGKNLRKLWEEARKFTERLEAAGVGRDVLEALRDFESFKQNVFKVWDALRYAGVPAPEPWTDPVEIISNYVFDDSVTLVFTRSIERAEELGRKILQVTGRKDRVSTHHHLLSRNVRREVEEAVKTGLMKVLISPRTLSQGIDIGDVMRVVHVGLPEDVREYYQREGRKGRRREIGLTETIVIPQGSWDYDLLSRSSRLLEKWLKLPLEKVLVNPDNKYSTLFIALAKIQSPILKDKLTVEELNMLRDLGLAKGFELTDRGKRVWRYMNFYEFAPPYGIKRSKIEDGEVVRLEDVSHCDLVEKFQPGAIDYTSDSVVTHHRLGGGRTVTAIFVEPLREKILRKYEGTAYTLEEYEALKRRWGEEPNIFKDYLHGKLHSRVVCVVHPPVDGFGKYVKIPNRVEWIVVAEKKKMVKKGEETVFYRDRHPIVISSPTYGKYEDFTYGLIVEVGLEEDPELLRLGLAYAMIVLRRSMGIPFETIMYSVIRLGERKFIALHEPESAGLMEKIDWSRVYREVENYTPDELDEIFLEAVDEYSFSTFISLKLDWSIAREYALKALSYLVKREKMILEFLGRRIEIPRPSKSLKIAAMSSLYIPVREEFNIGFYAISLYDGEENIYVSGITELGRPSGEYLKLHEELSKLLDSQFTVVVYGVRGVLNNLENAGLRSLKSMLVGLESSGSLIDVESLLREKMGLELGLEDLKKTLSLGTVNISRLTEYIDDLKRRIPGQRMLQQSLKSLDNLLKDFLFNDAKAIYISYIICRSNE